MIEIKGTYGEAKVFTEILEESAKGQIKALCEQPFIKDSKIRIMPDVHAGKGCTIGTTMTIGDYVVPNLVGVDIGCGMLTVALKEKSEVEDYGESFGKECISSPIQIEQILSQYKHILQEFWNVLKGNSISPKNSIFLNTNK